MCELVPYSEALARLATARWQVNESLLLLINAMEKEVEIKNPLCRESFKRMLVEIFTTMPEWNRQLAEEMAYNITTTRRWWTSESCPHQALWPQLFEWFKDKLNLGRGMTLELAQE